MINETCVENTLNQRFTFPGRDLQLYSFMAVQWAYADCDNDKAAELARLFWEQTMSSYN